MLAAIAALEAATSELRRAVLSGADTEQAGRHLASTSAYVCDLLPGGSPHPQPPAHPPATATPPATEPVTELVARPCAVERPADSGTRPRRPVTKPITKRNRPPRIDPSTVRVERNRDDYGPTWRVVAGDTDAPILVGYVEAARTINGNRSSNRWLVTTDHLTPLNRRARNRTEAVAVLLDSYLRAAGGTRTR